VCRRGCIIRTCLSAARNRAGKERIRRHLAPRIISWAIRSYALALFSTGVYLHADEMQKSVGAFIMRFPAGAIFSLAGAAL
jgi:hypothetical protein